MTRNLQLVILTLPIFFLLLLWLPKTVFATLSPALISPADDSNVTTSSLNWQPAVDPIASSNPYRIQVDDATDFSSPNKDYYTNNTYYSPVLTSGSWYWRVKVKDSGGIWSDWSNPWSFNLGQTDSPTPVPSSTSTPSPTSSSQTETTPSPTATTTPSDNSPSMQISTPPGSVHFDESFSLEISMQHFAANTHFYLKGAFIKPGSSNYFGQTQVTGNWIKNSQSYASQFGLTTDSSGNWIGDVEFMPDTSDSGFTGVSIYTFKVARYSAIGSGPTWSAENTISIVDIPTASSSPNPTNSPTPSPTPKLSSTALPTSSATEDLEYNDNEATSEANFTLPNLESSSSATVAGITTTALLQSLNNSTPKTPKFWYIIVGGICLIVVAISLAFTKSGANGESLVQQLLNHLKQKLPDAIPNQNS